MNSCGPEGLTVPAPQVTLSCYFCCYILVAQE